MTGREHGQEPERGLTPKQRTALELLRGSIHAGVPTTSGSAMIDGQPWIHWRTAYALHDRGLVRVEPYGEEDSLIFLPEREQVPGG